MTDIYTAQYSYPGDDRLDITVKGQHPVGKIFSPSWTMVTRVKSGQITPEQYEEMYRAILKVIPEGVYSELKKRESLVLVCFCKPFTFCHRVTLAHELHAKGIGKYLGEKLLDADQKRVLR